LGRKEDESIIYQNFKNFSSCKAFIIELLGCFINNRHCKNYKRKGKKIEGKESKNPKENYVTF